MGSQTKPQEQRIKVSISGIFNLPNSYMGIEGCSFKYIIARIWHSKHREFVIEYNDLGLEITRFWVLLRDAYAKWHESDLGETPDTLMDCVDAAPFPAGLPLRRGQILEEWVDADGLPNRALQDFLSAIYSSQLRSTAPTNEIAFDPIVIDGERRDEFHRVRMKLSKFWDRWGGEVFDTKLLSVGKIDECLQENSPLLKMLTYLECLLASAMPGAGKGRGKTNLFRLAKIADARRISDLKRRVGKPAKISSENDSD